MRWYFFVGLGCAVAASACAGPRRASAVVDSLSSRQNARGAQQDTPVAAALQPSALEWGRRAMPFYACMLRATDDKKWRRSTERSESSNADVFVASATGSPEDVAQVHVDGSDHGGATIYVPPTADTCGLHLDYSRGRVYSVLMSGERSACRLDFSVTGQSYWAKAAGKGIDVYGTEEDLDAFLAGGEVLRAAIEGDLTELRAEVAGAIAEGHLQHLHGHEGCVPVYEPFNAVTRRALLAKLDQEIARRRAALDAVSRVRDHVLAQVPCLAELVEPASVTTLARQASPVSASVSAYDGRKL